MHKLILSSLTLLSISLLISCQKETKQEDWQLLFNGIDLQGWETYIGPKYDSAIGDFAGEPIGLNVDPDGVFQVVQLDDEQAIRISGQHFGGLSTLRSFENYHLRLQFKWGTEKHAPRAKDADKRDSGLLYHARGTHAADWFFWMKSQEFQIQEGDCGDYWGLGSEFDIRAKMLDDSSYIYDAASSLLSFGSKSTLNRNVKKSGDAEFPTGQWNTLDLYCMEGTSLHVLNGKLMMRLENSREILDDGINPVTQGKIQIQSEGAEIFYKDIKIRKIDQLPNF